MLVTKLAMVADCFAVELSFVAAWRKVCSCTIDSVLNSAEAACGCSDNVPALAPLATSTAEVAVTPALHSSGDSTPPDVTRAIVADTVVTCELDSEAGDDVVLPPDDDTLNDGP